MQASTVMELSDKKNWPDNAVSLLQMFLDICEHLSCDTINSVNFETEFALLINKVWWIYFVSWLFIIHFFV